MKAIATLALASVAAIALGGAAFAADLAAPVAPVAAAPAPTNWDGAYLGANIGYGWGHSDHSDIVTTVGDFDMNGWLVGGQIGYNFHLTDGVVLGVQGDIDWTNITGTYSLGPTITDTINWEGAVTAHLGFDGGQFMPYILGGVVVANSTRTSSIGAASESQNHTGWTVGAGVEGMLADNISAFVEYRYNNFGTATYSTLASSPGVTLTDSEVRGGLNFHF